MLSKAMWFMQMPSSETPMETSLEESMICSETFNYILFWIAAVGTYIM